MQLHKHKWEPWFHGSYPPTYHAKCSSWFCDAQEHRWSWTDFDEFEEWIAEGAIRFRSDLHDPIEWVARHHADK